MTHMQHLVRFEFAEGDREAILATLRAHYGTPMEYRGKTITTYSTHGSTLCTMFEHAERVDAGYLTGAFGEASAAELRAVLGGRVRERAGVSR